MLRPERDTLAGGNAQPPHMVSVQIGPRGTDESDPPAYAERRTFCRESLLPSSILTFSEATAAYFKLPDPSLYAARWPG